MQVSQGESCGPLKTWRPEDQNGQGVGRKVAGLRKHEDLRTRMLRELRGKLWALEDTKT